MDYRALRTQTLYYIVGTQGLASVWRVPRAREHYIIYDRRGGEREDCSKKRFLFLEHFFSVETAPNGVRVLPGMTRHPILSRRVGTQRVALDRDRMRLRVKPARTQRVRRLGMAQDWPKVKTYRKVAVLLAKQAG